MKLKTNNRGESSDITVEPDGSGGIDIVHDSQYAYVSISLTWAQAKALGHMLVDTAEANKESSLVQDWCDTMNACNDNERKSLEHK